MGKFEPGDYVIVARHNTFVCGIEVLTDSFNGIIVKEFTNKDGKKYVEIDSDCGNRIILAEYVAVVEETNSHEYDGDYYIINCSECNNTRKVKSQHLTQVTRCRDCQNKRNAAMARERANKRYQRVKRGRK